jgi:hypothetical protein
MNMNRRQFICTGIAIAAALTGVAHASAAPQTMTVYKDPNCGCCHLWAEAMTAEGFDVKLEDRDDLTPIKAQLGVPANLQGCHTATVTGYFLEGHVPIEALRKLLDEKPPIAGLAVPGMPSGSLGMGDDPGAAYDVFAVTKAPVGNPAVYMSIRPKG